MENKKYDELEDIELTNISGGTVILNKEEMTKTAHHVGPVNARMLNETNKAAGHKVVIVANDMTKIQKKKDLTGSVVAANKDDMQKRFPTQVNVGIEEN